MSCRTFSINSRASTYIPTVELISVFFLMPLLDRTSASAHSKRDSDNMIIVIIRKMVPVRSSTNSNNCYPVEGIIRGFQHQPLARVHT